MVKLNVNLDEVIVGELEALLREYKDMFAWSYKDLTEIPLHIVEHLIELNITILPTHQAKYQMNPNYAVVVKHDLDKLFATRFIASIKEATWLSIILVVPKNNDKIRICVDFCKLDVSTKKDPYPFPFNEEENQFL